MIKRFNIDGLKVLLQGPLPGEKAQQKMAPEIRRRIKHEETCRSAAVLLLLFPENESTHTVFIKRNEYEGPHSGQISFPGGMFEESDKNLLNTALRETEEETGVYAGEIQVLGKLSPLYIPISNFCVSPYVGWISERPVFKPDSSEVQYLLTPTLYELTDPLNHRKETLQRHGYDIITPFIQIKDDIIWGATAMILSEFTELIGQ